MTKPEPANRPAFRRLALAPGLLGAVAAVVGILAIGSGFFIFVQFVITILAAIIGWFAVQARQWWWLPIPVAIAVLWNPVVPVTLGEVWQLPAQYFAALGFVIVGLVVRVPDDDTRR